MKLLILGGGELGVQACRLARAAGMHIIVADRDGGCPAAPMADELVRADVTAAALPEADYILPAVESEAVLDGLAGDNVLFDQKAWTLTASRFASNEFLRRHAVPVPEYFPNGSEPYIVKPDRGSFGRGIWVTEDFCEAGGAVNAGFIAEEELAGSVWSAAVIRRGGGALSYAPAKLSFDSRRRRTGAVCEDGPETEALRKTALRIAEALDLNGILEVEAIFHSGVWTVIDLNARLPMLTPDAVLEKTGVNLLAELCGSSREP